MRSPCCDESGLKKGPWTPEEDQKLVDYISAQGGHGSWKSLPKLAGLNRCGKSCRLRWTNYLKPDIKRGNFSEGEESIIINLHSSLGNKWSKIATYLPGRTDNEIKNYWNTHLRKKLLKMGIDPRTHRPRADLNFLMNLSQFLSPSIGLGLTSSVGRDMSLLRLLQADATQQAKTQYLQNLIQAISASSIPYYNNSLDQFQGLIGNNGSSFQSTIDPLQALLGLPSPLLGLPLPAGDADAISKCNPQEEKLSENNASDGCSLWDSNWYNGLQDEGNTLPELVSASEFENSQLMVNEMGSITTTDKASFSSNVFGDCNNWKKVMDDEAGGSFWEDIIH